jgi:hypothetical protein
VACQDRPATQVHHRAYDPATLRGECLEALSAVCRRCHYRAERPDRPYRRDSQRLHRANASVCGPVRRAYRAEQAERRALAKLVTLSDGTQAPRLVRA